MESIRVWATGLCLAAIGGVILRRIAPEKGSGRVFRVLLSAFFICVFFTPLYGLFSFTPTLSFDALPTDIQDSLLDETVTRQLKTAVETAAREIAETALCARGLSAEKIDVTTDTRADGSIYILRVDVTLDRGSRGHVAEAREVLQNRLETDVVVREAGE